MPTETLQIVIEAQNRSAGAFRQATSEVTNLSNVLRGLQGASRELDLFGALPGRLGTQVSYIRSAINDISRAFGDMKGMGGGTVGEQLAGMGYKLSDDVLKLNADLLQTGAASAVAGSGLSALTPIAVMGGVALAGVALAAGEAAIELGDAGQIAVQTERKFAAFSGGTAQAADNLALMRNATDNGLAAMDAMGASSMLLSMGLADSGEKAAELTRMAMMLGPAWRDAETNIHDFTMLLANQSIRRLDQFGLSVEGVRAKQQELMDQGFAKDIAFTNAVLEIGASKMLQLEKAGVVAATGSRQLEAAWKDLRMEISKPFAAPVGDIEAAVAAALRAIGRGVSGGNGTGGVGAIVARAALDEENRRSVLLAERGRLVGELGQRMGASQGTPYDKYQILETATAIERVNKALNAIPEDKLPKVAAGARQLPDTFERGKDAAIDLGAQIKAVSAEIAGLDNKTMAGLLDKEIKTWESAVAKSRGLILTYQQDYQQMLAAYATGDTALGDKLKESLKGVGLDQLKGDLKLAEQNLQGLTLQKRDIEIAILLTPAPETLADQYMSAFMSTAAQWGPIPVNPSLPQYHLAAPGLNPLRPGSEYENAFMGNAAGVSQDQYDLAMGALKTQTGYVQDAALESQRAWKDAANDTKKKWEDAVGFVESKFDKAIGRSVELKDFRPGKDGGVMSDPNGPFADIFRLQAWLTDGTWGETAKKYGITSKEEGQKLVGKFQMGEWDESVQKLFDWKKLEQAVLSEKQAIEWKKLVAEKIAKATGAGTEVVDATIWGGAYTDASAQQTKMNATGQNMSGALITGIKKAEPDLWTAGYNAAMAMQAGWNAAQSGKPNGSSGGSGGSGSSGSSGGGVGGKNEPLGGYGVIGSLRMRGVQE